MTAPPRPGDDVPGAPPPLLSARPAAPPVVRDTPSVLPAGDSPVSVARRQEAAGMPLPAVVGLVLGVVVVLALLRRRSRPPVVIVRPAP